MKNVNMKEQRLGQENHNYQGCLMKIIEYNLNRDMIIEFQDKYKAKVHASYSNFLKGKVKNPYYPSVREVGMIGCKYSSRNHETHAEEYLAWSSMLNRCFDKKFKEKNPTYKDVTCCDEWLLYENFYEWLHSQNNFGKWLNGKQWALDKDILVKGNKIYSPDTCCLVPQNINSLFSKSNVLRGELPIGVNKYWNKFCATCMNTFTNKKEHIGLYSTPEEAFYAYKAYKECLIKQVAQEEYDKGNITEKCYESMMNYKVEIFD